MGRYVVTEVKEIPDKLAFIYEYKDGKTGKTSQKVIIIDSNTPEEKLRHLEPALEGHFGAVEKPKLILKLPFTVEIDIHD